MLIDQARTSSCIDITPAEPTVRLSRIPWHRSMIRPGSWCGKGENQFVFADGEVVAEVRFRSRGSVRSKARLIAAAPELLDALQYVMSATGEQLTDAFEKAEKAIAKATGGDK